MDKRISNFGQVCSLRRYTFTSGKEKGLDVIDCDNGKIRFLVNASKACDIMQLYHEGSNVSFLSKNAFTAREIDFINRFEGGMLYTCGLDSVGGRDGHELHGTIHNTAPEITRAEANEDGIMIEATVRSTALFGENLVLKRRITSAIGGDGVTVEDELVNEGYHEENYCLLYHINVGYPMLTEGAKIIADVNGYVPRTPFAKSNEKDVFVITPPEDCREETCYFLDLAKPEISLVNETAGKKLTVSYSGDSLTEFVEWKSMASGDYALGLEPATTRLDDGFRYRKIAAGEKVTFSVKISVTRV